MINLEEIKSKVRNEIENLAAKQVPNDDFNIFGEGFLDSLNVLHIILFMETEFGMKINPYDLHIDVLNSVNKIVSFIESKIND